MSDVTCAEFGRLMAEAVERMDAEWRSRRADNPERFPERLALREWWSHFATVVMPEMLLAEAAHPVATAVRATAATGTLEDA